MKIKKLSLPVLTATLLVVTLFSCKPKNAGNAVSGDAATKVYVAPGKYDEFYNFVSGGFSGQMSVYGLPSGRLLPIWYAGRRCWLSKSMVASMDRRRTPSVICGFGKTVFAFLASGTMMRCRTCPAF